MYIIDSALDKILTSDFYTRLNSSPGRRMRLNFFFGRPPVIDGRFNGRWTFAFRNLYNYLHIILGAISSCCIVVVVSGRPGTEQPLLRFIDIICPECSGKIYFSIGDPLRKPPASVQDIVLDKIAE